MGLHEKYNKEVTFTHYDGRPINNYPDDYSNNIAGAIAWVDYDGEAKNDDDNKNTAKGPGEPQGKAPGTTDMEPNDDPE